MIDPAVGVSVHCPCCAAPVRFASAYVTQCEFCRAEVRRPALKRESREATAAGADAQVSCLVERMYESLERGGGDPDLEEAETLVRLSPTTWHGYCFRAHTLFATVLTTGGDPHAFARLVDAAIADLERCDRFGGAAESTDLRVVCFRNLAQVGAYQTQVGFTGQSVDVAVAIIKLCSLQLPDDEVVRACARRCGAALIIFAREELEKAASRAGTSFVAPENYLNFLLLAWESFGVSDGLSDFATYARMSVSNTYSPDLKARLSHSVSRLEQAGLVAPPTAKKKWFGLF